MDSIKITFTEQEARDLAEQYFIQYCGLDLSKEKHSRMYREAMDVREKGIGGIRLSALISSCGPEAFSNHKVVFRETEINSEAFSQIPDENVQKVYLYLITAGECGFDPDDSIIRQLYADIWGTVYVDAGRVLLENAVEKYAEDELRAKPGTTGYLSCPFSPGFYGMRAEESKKIGEILSGRDIGISVRDNGVMLPLKTCSGIYLVVKDPSGLPMPECKACIGNEKGCPLCKVMADRACQYTNGGGRERHDKSHKE